MNAPSLRLLQTSDVFVKQVVCLTVNHRGPLPFGELHSTDETRVWRDPGGSWACLRPARNEFNLVKLCHKQWHSVKQVILTVNHRGPLPERELHSTDETRVWRDPGGSWACLRPVTHECTQTEAVTEKWHRSFVLQWTTADPSPWGNFTPPAKQQCGETLGDLEPVYDLLQVNSPHQKLCHRQVAFCETGSFSYGESPRTPPLDGTSLHRRNKSVERPWGILACLRLQFTVAEAVTQTKVMTFCGAGPFLTVNHRGPLPVGELHSIDKTIVWRDPGGSWACLRPATSEFTIPEAVSQTVKRHFCKSQFFLQWITADASPQWNCTPQSIELVKVRNYYV